MYAEAFRAAAYTPRAHTPTRAAGGTATTTMAGFSEPNAGSDRFASQVRLAESTHRFAANARSSQRGGVPFIGDPAGGTPFNGRPSTPPRGGEFNGTTSRTTGGPPSSPMGQSPYMQQRRGSNSSQLSLRSGGSVRGPVSQQRTISRGQLTVLRENAV